MIELINSDFLDVPTCSIGRVDLIFADPPDGIGMKYNGYNDNISPDDYYIKLSHWLHKMNTLTEGPIFFTFNSRWTREVEDIIYKLNIPLIQRIQWYFTFGQDQTSKGKYALCYRPIYWLKSDFVQPHNIKIPSARQEKYHDKRAATSGKMPTNVWEFPRICGTFKERRKWVPTQINEAVIERIIRGHCLPGGRVLDPFLGSGSTAVVCQRLEIDCIGIEISNTTAQKTAEYLGITVRK